MITKRSLKRFLMTLILVLFVLIPPTALVLKLTGDGPHAEEVREIPNDAKTIVTVYSDSGEIIAQHTGDIKLHQGDHGIIFFTFEGKAYTYSNGVVETITKED